jgi:glutaminyl-tRNA synthetase
MSTENNLSANFIQNIINEERQAGDQRRIHTRFPPEPNGYLHIGHAKSICLNFGLAKDNGGLCNLRFDDTNPTKEDTEYVDSIMEDIRWLGFDWQDRLFYASDYFQQFYDYAEQLIKDGHAYICDHSPAEIKQLRGTLKEPGQECSHRQRSVEENLELFRRMKAGEFPDGAMVLRAKIDMASPNLNMRDPVLYRILHAYHHRTGDQWCIYPMYDYAHPLSDYLEGITHSVCTLEFEDHRPLYDWVLETLKLENRPRQIEFARLNLSNTLMSKRFLRALVEEGKVSGWDDPRMSTLCGVRRLGYPPEAIRDFCDRIGVAKANSLVDKALLEHCVREALGVSASRVMAVLRPLKVVLTNYPADETEWLEVELHPDRPEAGSRKVPFTRELYIEEDDFMEEPVKKFFRLSPGKEVRLKNGYIICCNEVIKDPATGKILELHCTYDPQTKSGQDHSGKKVKGTIHWVSAVYGVPVTVRLYDDLLLSSEMAENEAQDPDQQESSLDETQTGKNSDGPVLNPNSLITLSESLAEPYLLEAPVGERFQFLRLGYFIKDKDSTAKRPVFNRIVSLKDSWAKIEKQR